MDTNDETITYIASIAYIEFGIPGI